MDRRNLMVALFALMSASVGPALAADFKSDRISVTTVGSGDDVILIPGLNSSPRVWAEMTKALPGHRYHLVHLSGFAGRDKGGTVEGAVSAPVAEEIARYIAVAKLKSPAVIGHSMGGTIGLMLAARHPQAISKLMVVDMLPFMGAMFGPPGTTAQSVKPTADAILTQMKAANPAARRSQAEAVINSMVNTEAKRPGAIEDSMTSDLDVSARAFHELIVTDLGSELPKIVVPTTVLYVTPKGTPLTDAEIDGLYLMTYAPLKGARLKRIPESAHFFMWDQPERFQSEVNAFLG
jgi:pimeloyl-ACP methyl ester carboxylesterase